MLSRVSRRLSTISSAHLKQSPGGEPLVSLHVAHEGRNGRLVLPLCWLRDHCRSEESYNHSTNQRRTNGTELKSKARIASADAVSLDQASQKLKIAWADGHQSIFETKQLINSAIKKEPAALNEVRTLWTAQTFSAAKREIPTVPLANLNFAVLAERFIRYGFVCIDGVEERRRELSLALNRFITTLDDTEQFDSVEASVKLCKEISPYKNSFYSNSFVLTNTVETTPGERPDNVYTNQEVGPHMDGTYFQQVLHCLKQEKKGGDSLLVDSFAAAERLRAESPEAFRVLTETPVTHQYALGKGENALISLAPERRIIELDDSGRIRQIRFNPYDRADLPAFRLAEEGDEVPRETEQVAAFYVAYEKFSLICHDPSMMLKFSLQPGTLILIDNHRVLHGRTEILHGDRALWGTFLSRDDFLAKARPLLSERIHFDV